MKFAHIIPTKRHAAKKPKVFTLTLLCRSEKMDYNILGHSQLSIYICTQTRSETEWSHWSVLSVAQSSFFSGYIWRRSKCVKLITITRAGPGTELSGGDGWIPGLVPTAIHTLINNGIIFSTAWFGAVRRARVGQWHSVFYAFAKIGSYAGQFRRIIWDGG